MASASAAVKTAAGAIGGKCTRATRPRPWNLVGAILEDDDDDDFNHIHIGIMFDGLLYAGKGSS